MAYQQLIDRRHTKFKPLRLEQPLFMQVKKRLAAACLVACALVAMITNAFAPTISFGPFFLLICALGAWFVGNFYAVALGLLLASLQILSGRAMLLQDRPVVMALQYCSALAVVLMLGVARAALEIEWRFGRVDPLTGALNRKAFFEAVRNHGKRRSMAILVFADIDGLKRLNDLRGHEAGDEALRNFSDRVKGAVRSDDIFARIGGDEFVIFMKIRSLEAAELVAQRLNGVLNVKPYGKATGLKCSLGVLVLPKGSRSIDFELRQADTLMYRAKREKKGIMTGMAEGDIEAPMPLHASVRNVDEQRAAVRSCERPPEFNVSDGVAKTSIAA